MARARTMRVVAVAGAAVLLLLGSIACWWMVSSRAAATPPLAQNLTYDHPLQWQQFGGRWDGAGGAIRNVSAERGAKLMSGSPNWTDYSIEGDINLLGRYGDAGFIVRASGEEEGANSYHGYFAGLRNMDGTLVLGRSDFGWSEYPARPIPSGVEPFEWFHLKMIAYGCDIAVSVITPQGRTLSASANDPDCLHSGRLGLKSFNTGAMWRNVTVRPATRQDLVSMIGATEPPPAVVSSWPGDFLPSALDRYVDPLHRQAEDHRFDLDARTIGSLRSLTPSNSKDVTVHGVVSLISPAFFVQDASGGMALTDVSTSSALQVGDEVEAKGEVVQDDFGPVMKNATVRLRWSNPPPPPLALTAFQLASGSYNGVLVQVEGRLQKISSGSADTIVFNLENGTQSFQAIASDKNLEWRDRLPEDGSWIRLRGVCALDSKYTGNLVPFVLLLPSIHDVRLVSSPPWWNPRHIILLALGIFALALALQVAVSRIEHWRFKAVLDERERLAMEMHDTLAQSFAGIGFQLQAIREDLRDNEPLRKQLDTALAMARMSHREARRNIAALRPSMLVNKTLLEALVDAARSLVTGGSIDIVQNLTGKARTIPIKVSDALFRIGQEAISNSIRHAQPTKICISLAFEPRNLKMSIADNGIWNPAEDVPRGFGIPGMIKRAEAIGAHLDILNEPGRGTSVIANVPLTADTGLFRSIRHSAQHLWEFITHGRFAKKSND